MNTIMSLVSVPFVTLFTLLTPVMQSNADSYRYEVTVPASIPDGSGAVRCLTTVSKTIGGRLLRWQ